MSTRPLSITIVAWLFILVGGAGLADTLSPLFHAGGVSRLMNDAVEWRDFWIVFTLRAIALLGGVLMLLGHGWARWLLAVWMAAHVVISLQHSWTEALMHVVIFGAVSYFLFRPSH